MSTYERDADAERVLIVGTDGTASDPATAGVPTSAKLHTPANSDISGGPYSYFSFAVAGTINVTPVDDAAFTIPSGALSPGLQHALRFTRINATGTSATGFVIYK